MGSGRIRVFIHREETTKFRTVIYEVTPAEFHQDTVQYEVDSLGCCAARPTAATPNDFGPEIEEILRETFGE